MGVVGCGLCGYQIRYHGEPEGEYPIEHIFCHLSDWRRLEEENLTADWLEFEHDEIFFYAWRCARCGTFSFFNDRWKSIGVYTPKEEFSSEPMQEPFEFGPFWDDFQWFDITENAVRTSEVLTKYPDNRWLAKNADEMRLYEDEAMTKCVAQFRRFEFVERVTVQTMSLAAFKKMLVNYKDEVDFFWRNMSYEIIKEPLADSRTKIIVNRDFDDPTCIYSATVADGENFVDDLVSAKILGGKSIAELQAEIRL